MGIPRSLQRAAEEAEKILEEKKKEMGKKAEEEVVDQEVDEETELQSALDDEIPVEDDDLTTPDDTSEDEEEDSDQDQDAAPVQKEEDVRHEDDALLKRTEKAEAKYKSLQGKYNKEVPRLNAEIADLKAEVEKLKGNAEKRPSKPAHQRYLDDSDSDEYGDYTEVAGRAAKGVAEETVGEAVNPVKAKLAKVEQALFYSDLKDEVPDWKTIDESQEWLDWLAEEDPLTGKLRNDALVSAYNKLDANGVARVFNLYKAQADIETEEPAENRQEKLKREALPDVKKRSGSKPTSPKKWSQKEIAQHYERVASYQRKNKPISKELQRKFDATDAEITKAIKSGNVTR